MVSAETTLDIVEKSLINMPIYGPKADIWAAAAALKVLQVRFFIIKSNKTSHSC
jgi:hypothetical protein